MQKIKIILFLCFTSLCLVSNAQNLIKFNDASKGSYIGKNALIFQDQGKNYTFEYIKNHPELFKANGINVINFGVNDDNNWIKFRILNQSDYNKILLNLSYPVINETYLYIDYKNRPTDSTYTSESTPLIKRNYNHQFYIFDVNLAKGDSATCYLKLRSNKQILVPITLETPESILKKISNTDSYAGLYFGIMLVMLVYNLFIYFTVADYKYIVYVNYIFWVTAAQATILGYASRLVPFSNPWVIEHMVTFTGAMSGIATVLITKSFLDTKRNVPRLNPFINLIILGDLIAICALIINRSTLSYNIVNINAAIGSLFVLFVAIYLYREKYRPAGFFLLSWTIFLLGVIIYVIKDYGILPYNALTVHAGQLGSALEAILLSFALADSINTLKKEKEESQAETLIAVQENARIIREQNVILEGKVVERTAELQASNTDLNKALIDLKEAEAHLVESEKMASLGQLTAGIAHEINNPINFVTSNVGPLKRDIEMLFDAITTIEEVGLSEDSTEEKQNQIEEYKEDIDFDYLKTEIGFLLKGIHEGASRTAEIVKGLRVFSRLDEDDLKKADVNEGLESTMVIANNLLSNKIQVIKQYGDIPLIECYPGKLNQVFLNIISNAVYAIKKQHEDKPGGILKIVTCCNDKNVFIKIEDNGIGMDEMTKKKIFEPFFTTKDVGEGTGLGMSITYNTIKKHNGQIHINSTPGAGTEFIIELPLQME